MQGPRRPPGLDEPVTQLNVRIPSSTREDLRLIAEKLRRRIKTAGRYGLPEQDLVAFAIWMLGDPEDEVALETLRPQYEAFYVQRLRDYTDSVGT